MFLLSFWTFFVNMREEDLSKYLLAIHRVRIQRWETLLIHTDVNSILDKVLHNTKFSQIVLITRRIYIKDFYFNVLHSRISHDIFPLLCDVKLSCHFIKLIRLILWRQHHVSTSCSPLHHQELMLMIYWHIVFNLSWLFPCHWSPKFNLDLGKKTGYEMSSQSSLPVCLR